MPAEHKRPKRCPPRVLLHHQLPAERSPSCRWPRERRHAATWRAIAGGLEVREFQSASYHKRRTSVPLPYALWFCRCGRNGV